MTHKTSEKRLHLFTHTRVFTQNGAAQDLLLLDSPKDEVEFDPLFTKDIPPPVPSRQHKQNFTNAGKLDE